MIDEKEEVLVKRPKERKVKIPKQKKPKRSSVEENQYLEFDPSAELNKVVEDKSLQEAISTQPNQNSNSAPKRRQKTEALIHKTRKLKEEGFTNEQIGYLLDKSKSTISLYLRDSPKETMD